MSISSKRQQRRNEQALQDLIQNVPGNSECADCKTKNPGNIASNAIWNPDPARNPLPVNADEDDSTMERYIRAKYEQGKFRKDAKRTNSFLSPEPSSPSPSHSSTAANILRKLSPKPSKSALKPRSFSTTGYMETVTSPQSEPKASRILGMHGPSNSIGIPPDLESKVEKLKDMGFSDTTQSVQILRSVSGNLEQAVEALIRISGDTSPVPPPKDKPVVKKASRVALNGNRDVSTDQNPYEALDTVSPLPRLQTPQAAFPSMNNYQNYTTTPVSPTNPFLGQNQFPAQQVYAQPQIQQQFSNPYQQYQQQQQQINLLQQQQQQAQLLQQAQAQQQLQYQQQQPLQAQLTGNLSQQYMNAASPQQQLSVPYGQQPIAAQMTGNNPFFQVAPASPSNPYLQPQQQIPNQGYMQNPFQNQLQQPALQTSIFGEPIASNGYPVQQNYQQVYQQQQLHPQQYAIPQLSPQTTGKADKSTILALYNYPQLAPTPSSTLQPAQEVGMKVQRSVSAPIPTVTGSKNPFAAAAAAMNNSEQTSAVLAPAPVKAQPASGSRHVTQESVDFHGWQSGRHSPDAFANLSAKFRH